MSLTNEDKQWISEQLAAFATKQEMEGIETNLLTELHQGFERIDARLDRQGGLLRSGQTNLVRLNTWSEDIDQILAKRDKRISELDARVTKLERRNGGTA